MNVHERMIARIRKAKPVGEDRRVLDYIAKELSPARLEKREANGTEGDPSDTAHLIAVAKQRLKPYEKEAGAA